MKPILSQGTRKKVRSEAMQHLAGKGPHDSAGHHNIKGYAHVEYFQGGGSVDSTGDAPDVDTSPDPGAVDEAITSISLDQREHNPDHAAEDAEPLATRPPGPPSSPNNFGYKRGGPVKRRIGYQQGGEVDDEEDPTEGTDEEEQDTSADEGDTEEDDGTEADDEEKKREREVAGTEPGEEPPEGDQDPLGKTGYNAPPSDQGDRVPKQLKAQQAAAQQPTGYDRSRPAPDSTSSLLRQVLDWTRNVMLSPASASTPTGGAAGAPTAEAGAGTTPSTMTTPPPTLTDLATTPAGEGGIGSDAARTPDMATPAPATPPPPPVGILRPINAAIAGGKAIWSGLNRGPAEAASQAGGPAGVGEPKGPLAPVVNWLRGGAQAAPATPPSPTQGGGIGSDAARAPNQPAPAAQTAAAQRALAPYQQMPGGGQMQDVQTALRDYVNGARSFTPEQMTELLNRTSQTSPGLDMNGAIAKTFRDLAASGDMDGASRFLQSLRPSYDKVRAVTIAALNNGNLPQAMQLATQLDNLLPGGTNVSFNQGPNGSVNALVRPEGSPAQAFAMTPQQFAQYMQSPNTLFDQSAETGIQNALQQVGARMVGTSAQPTNAPTGLTGYTQQSTAPIPGTALAQAQAPAAQTGYAPAVQRTRPDTGEAMTASERQQLQRAQANRDYDLQMQAYRSFPMSNQRNQRAQLLERLRGQDARVMQEAVRQQGRMDVVREQNLTRETPAERFGRESMRQDRLDDRAQRQLDSITDRRNADNLTRATNAAQRDAINNIISLRRGNPDYRTTPQEQRFIDNIYNRAMTLGGAPAAPAAPDVSQYRGDNPPYAAPEGQRWGRSKSSGEWSLRPLQ